MFIYNNIIMSKKNNKNKYKNTNKSIADNDILKNIEVASIQDSDTLFYQNILNIFSNKYPSLKNVGIKTNLSNKSFQGLCNSVTVGDFTYFKKIRCKNVLAHSITIDITQSKNSALFTFLHEMCHAVTPYCERKVKNQWIRFDHSHLFYNNFLIITNIAFSLNIIDRPYTLKELKQKDEMKTQYKSDMKRFGN
jgi:hypothetical protein